MVSVSSSSDGEGDEGEGAESGDEYAQKSCEQIVLQASAAVSSDTAGDGTTEGVKSFGQVLLEAAALLPFRPTRGEVPGLEGTYGARIGRPSRTTEWRRRVDDQEAAAQRAVKDAAFQRDPAERSMITHFFKPAGPAAEPSGIASVVESHATAPAESDASPTESNALPAESDAELMTEDDEIEDIVIRRAEGKVAASDRMCLAPDLDQAAGAIHALLGVMRTRRGTGHGWKYTQLDLTTFKRLDHMLGLFRLYAEDPVFRGRWKPASVLVARSGGKGTRYAQSVRAWCRDFLVDGKTLPTNNYSKWPTSVLHTDEDLKVDITAHLQRVGQFFSAQDLLECLNKSDTLERLGRQKGFSLRTAQRWLKLMGYRWKPEARGMYFDGHEREDVVLYRQQTFLPRYLSLSERAAQFDDNGVELPREPPLRGKEVIFHHHDESIFYGNDRRKLRWVHDSESPKPYAKGEGQSLMVADFVSSTLGWLSSPDGYERARVTLRPGKGRDGYFSCGEVLEQLTTAMNILDKHYASYEHVFVLDNARTHTKRAESALSARRMPKNPRRSFEFDTVVRDSSGKAVLGQNGEPRMERRRMDDATFADGAPQSLYFPRNHSRYPGYFKGMTEILRERGFDAPEKIRAECKGFKCVRGAESCCQRRILFNQPDFASVPSLVERHCAARGYEVLFLPKFHPELNFIEMCWGYGKRLYRELPPSPRIDDIESNALWALGQIPLTAMRR